ncbi:CAAX prenyl protease [Rhodotorula paludigena]|uniref:CAAX prenyl protease n=1 Tax=Rhodotorula paludigena TaxID=86838 RepID=UPI0031723756
MPLLSPTSTLLTSSAFTSAYLASIYLLPSTRISVAPHSPPAQAQPSDIAATVPAVEHRDRNHPNVIKARLLAVSLASLGSCASLPLVLQRAAPATYPSYTSATRTALRLLGFAPLPSTWSGLARLLLYPAGLTASLFAGSLYVAWLEGDLPGQRGARTWAQWKARFGGWRGVRNYILAPLTEELSFRSCIVAASFLGGCSTKQLIFLTPLWFGLAHVHHAWETYLAGGRTKQALTQGVMQSTFQFVYTTLFGWYATFLFLRTGSIIPPFLAHAFCNTMGLPPLAWALKVWPEKKASLWGTYIAGISTFVYGFWRWTDPALFGGANVYWQ